ncbi:DUF2807 domain-containing protein [Bernardetia sp. Wsw4-3y2]|uniref:GIN domain-containing protein n=1 Tax=Bernardetia sp. Wsw4-3y2 TaxID=3127471 RepID=UPI0030D3B2EA
MQNHFKIYFLPLFVLFLLSTSCSLTDSVCKDGQGDVITESRTISKFTAIESRGNFIVNVFQDSSIKTQSVSVMAQENIISFIQTNIIGNSLIIDNDECYNTSEEVIIEIRTPVLSQIVLSGSGDIVLQDIARISNVENIENVEFILNGSGNILTTPNNPIITTGNCTAKLKGSGNIELELEVANKVTAILEGSGTILFRGIATENSLNVSGSGNIKAFLLPVLTSTAEIVGSGSIELTATDDVNTPSKATLNAQVSGSGVVRVKGNAGVQWNVSGSGKIEKVE